MTTWQEEALYQGCRSRLEVSEILYDSQTEHQRLVIFENSRFGRVMMLDGVTQTTEADEFIYHEMLTHLPILAHGNVQRILIIGGGDGGTAEEALKHSTIEHITMVEIDATVVELSKKYLPAICGNAFDDPRLDLVIADGVDYVAKYEGPGFDLIIIDSTDPIGPGEVLFTKDFYTDCKSCLAAGGIIVTQNGVPFMQGEELRGTMQIFESLFDDATCYLASVPTYVGGPMAFGWGTDNATARHTPIDVIARRFDSAGVTTGYYLPEMHAQAFALPRYVDELVNPPVTR